MKVVIIEDEMSVAQNLTDLLHEINPEIEVLAVLETIKDSILWFQNNKAPDMAFFDIKIADGDSFEILEGTSFHFPIIFTTAYDEYALKAFKYNSIDYLLKPINKSDLEKAILKYQNLYIGDQAALTNNSRLLDAIKKIREASQDKIYKKSLLVSFGNQLIPLNTNDIAFFHLENNFVYCKTHTGKTYQVSTTLEKITEQLDPTIFFRVNRQVIVSKLAVKLVKLDEKRKLKLITSPVHSSDIMISKLKATVFKRWLKNGSVE